LRKDLLFELPNQLKKTGVKALIVPIEDWTEVPAGAKKQVEIRCNELGLECAFPKPFCSLSPRRVAYDRRFIEETKVGRPLLEITMRMVDKKDYRMRNRQTQRTMWVDTVHCAETRRSAD